MNISDGPEIQVSELRLVKTELFNRLKMLQVKIESRISTLDHYKLTPKKFARAVRLHLLFPLITCRNELKGIEDKLRDKCFVDFHTYQGVVYKPFREMMLQDIRNIEDRFRQINEIGNKRLKGE